jgi:prepilin signal peptidase PulO-like enzyme (type II secretory pathway)
VIKYKRWWEAVGYALAYNLFAIVPFAIAAAAGWPLLWGMTGFVVILSMAVGSFLTLAIYRIPRGMSLNDPPSSCPHCHAWIRTRHNIPVLGWVLLRGRCAACAARISWRYPVVEMASGIIIGTIFFFAMS